ncbi:hypothetical protein J6590_000300 [Homalodisca vitripennis]|nr:hypothetical protein J6590_000300 [Homalodisca vitripennis]
MATGDGRGSIGENLLRNRSRRKSRGRGRVSSSRVTFLPGVRAEAANAPLLTLPESRTRSRKQKTDVKHLEKDKGKIDEILSTVEFSLNNASWDVHEAYPAVKERHGCHGNRSQSRLPYHDGLSSLGPATATRTFSARSLLLQLIHQQWLTTDRPGISSRWHHLLIGNKKYTGRK